ncbi:MAG TPA: hypothetical protein PKA27_11475 [Fimbriimonadaceae bacterium]|nr:hypothetical protein [Fimbriimonadaceae bacterium]
MSVLLAALVLATQEKHTPKPLPQAAKSFVTVGEANTVLFQLESATRKILKVGGSAKKPSENKKEATRAQIIDGLFAIYEVARPKFRIAPNPIKFDDKVFSVTGQSRGRLQILVRQGFVGRVSPLATSKTPGLSLEEFGDSIGLFVARLADLSHTPSRQWSPYLWDR